MFFLGKGEVDLGGAGNLGAQLTRVGHGVVHRVVDVLVEEGGVDEIVNLQRANKREILIVDLLRVRDEGRRAGNFLIHSTRI